MHTVFYLVLHLSGSIVEMTFDCLTYQHGLPRMGFRGVLSKQAV